MTNKPSHEIFDVMLALIQAQIATNGALHALLIKSNLTSDPVLSKTIDDLYAHTNKALDSLSEALK